MWIFFPPPPDYMWTFAIQNLPTDIAPLMHDKLSLFFNCRQRNMIIYPKTVLAEFKKYLQKDQCITYN